MSIEAQESSGINSDDGGDFECNICFELAADPVITVCGHLYCWPCLYKWLRLHSRSQGCPVCKALIREEKLIPLYGRGKIPTDPRSKHVAGVEIPSRPAGQRPETAPSLEASNISNLVTSLPAFSPNFSIQVHRFSNAREYDATRGYHHRHSRPFRGPEGEILDRESNNVREAVGILKKIHFVVFVLAVFALLLL